jgi:hypothetical protein
MYKYLNKTLTKIILNIFSIIIDNKCLLQISNTLFMLFYKLSIKSFNLSTTLLYVFNINNILSVDMFKILFILLVSNFLKFLISAIYSYIFTVISN